MIIGFGVVKQHVDNFVENHGGVEINPKKLGYRLVNQH